MSVTDTWRPKRPGPASDRDNVTRQTLRAGIHAPPPEKPYVSNVVWYGMVEVCEGAPVAVSGWVLTDRHDVRPCAASSLHRETISVSNVIGEHGNTRHSVGMKLFGLGPTSSTG